VLAYNSLEVEQGRYSLRSVIVSRTQPYPYAPKRKITRRPKGYTKYGDLRRTGPAFFSFFFFGLSAAGRLGRMSLDFPYSRGYTPTYIVIFPPQLGKSLGQPQCDPAPKGQAACACNARRETLRYPGPHLCPPLKSRDGSSVPHRRGKACAGQTAAPTLNLSGPEQRPLCCSSCASCCLALETAS
jgi:hypothetical protein